MIDKGGRPTQWATRVQGDVTASLARDFKAIGVNFAQCQACRGRWFTVSCFVEGLHDLLAPRLVTTLVIVAAVMIVVVGALA